MALIRALGQIEIHALGFLVIAVLMSLTGIDILQRTRFMYMFCTVSSQI